MVTALIKNEAVDALEVGKPASAVIAASDLVIAIDD